MPKFGKAQKGQTLIETLVACFVLTMGISSALILANYSLQATSGIKQQIIAMGLAREGIEVVKNMRDTNWLKAPYNTDCYNFSTGENNAICYREWLKTSEGYTLTPGDYSLRFTFGNKLPWSLVETKADFGLNFAKGEGVLYNAADGLTASTGGSGFARKISITEDNFPPFDTDNGSRIKVSVKVWWSDKDCVINDEPSDDKNCTLTLETYLTNWRVF